MTFAIHDKSREGRRKMKEGPKAQQAYCDDLAQTWWGDDDKPAPTREGPPPAVRARARKLEAETRDKMNREHRRRTAAAKKFITRTSGLIVPGTYGY